MCHDDKQRSQSIILTTSKSLTKKYVTDDKLCIDVWFVIHFGERHSQQMQESKNKEQPTM